MCGICGFFGERGNRTLLASMCSSIIHRGPDSSGYFDDSRIGLGMRRLSIIDVEGGHQPLFNEDGSVCVVFNGELYNFSSLREELEKKGHRFSTASDTETVVHLYEELGEGCVRKLRGMFAFALYDSRRKTLLLARDRLGIKPLYYTMLGGKTLLFASEIKAILQHPEVERAVNGRALDRFMSLRYVPCPETMFDGVYKLQPAHTMSCAIEPSGKISVSVKRYWEIPIYAETQKTEGQHSAELRRLLEESVGMHLMSEVPLGLFLSGGLDSSAIAGLMARHITGEKIKTFSVGFAGASSVDETSNARKVAECLGTEHHELIVSDEDIVKSLPKTIWHLDEPVGDATNIPTFLLSEFTRKKGVTVALAGEGGDEAFAGYFHHRLLLHAEKLKRFPAILKKRLGSIAGRLPLFILNRFFRYPSSMGEGWRRRLADFVSTAGDRAGCYSAAISIFDVGEKSELLGRQAQPTRPIFVKYFENPNSQNLFNQLLRLESETWLPDYILARLDKMTMAHSLEGRVPFLDHNLIEFSSRIPPSLKIRGGVEKYILRKAVFDVLPAEVLKRKKHPFFVPIDQWFSKNGGLRDYLGGILDSGSSGYFRKEYVKGIFDKYEKSRLYCSRQLWNILTFELWHKTFVLQKSI